MTRPSDATFQIQRALRDVCRDLDVQIRQQRDIARATTMAEYRERLEDHIAIIATLRLTLESLASKIGGGK